MSEVTVHYFLSVFFTRLWAQTLFSIIEHWFLFCCFGLFTMATEDLTFKIEKLTADNYHSWKFNMKMYLIGIDLWEIFTGAEIMDNDLSDAEKWKFKKRKNQALTAICPGISTNLQIYVRSSETAQDAWENLEKHFQLKTLSKKIFYQKEAIFRSNGKKGKIWQNMSIISKRCRST